jgi:putative NADPH-quinone reductase
MRCLVVMAHSLSDSLYAATARRAVDALDRAGDAMVIEDLYATGFAAAMTAGERASDYRGPFAGGSVAA